MYDCDFNWSFGVPFFASLSLYDVLFPISERHTSSSLHNWEPKRGGVSLEKEEEDVARRETSQPFGTGSGEMEKMGVGRQSIGFSVCSLCIWLYLLVEIECSTS